MKTNNKWLKLLCFLGIHKKITTIHSKHIVYWTDLKIKEDILFYIHRLENGKYFLEWDEYGFCNVYDKGEQVAKKIMFEIKQKGFK